ncbi:hypothetical protein GLOIN_2v1764020 [Rhizophagus clarus]|nr:hypothetical protein GLOIN_2v1764020 [Rhizophagus clarus]
MVNRLWCETVIPILWKNPWRYNIDYYNKDYLLAIIASYLSDEFLMRQRIQLLSASNQSLLFDYFSFCRSINVNIINSIISIGSPSLIDQLFLQREFYGLLVKKCPELKYLDISSIKYNIIFVSEDKLRFESLYELKCDTSNESSFFYELAHICQHIQRLIITNDVGTKSNLGIAKLIEIQKNLKYFEWKDNVYDFIFIDSYMDIFLALEKKADIINHLYIYFQRRTYSNVIDSIFPKFHKLKTLIFNNFSYIKKHHLKMCIYHDLEVFKIYYDLKVASIIIENSGGFLKKILISYSSFDGCFDDYDNYENFDECFDDYDNYENFNEDSFILIRKIHENCPLIEYLCLLFSSSKEHFTEIEKLLKDCKYLKTLLIVIKMNGARTEKTLLENGENLLKALISSTPTNLKEIRFFYDYKFSLEALEKFLENWKGCALSILTCDPIYNEENYTDLINKYKNNGVIKDFRYKCEF